MSKRMERREEKHVGGALGFERPVKKKAKVKDGGKKGTGKGRKRAAAGGKATKAGSKVKRKAK